jgi:hypothetical protein
MARPAPLTESQKKRLSSLEPALKSAVYAGDYKKACIHAQDIQKLLRATGHETRLMQSKNWLFEAALNAGQILTAEAGFRGVRAKTDKSTRVHLEATALLAVCLIRQKKLDEAEPLMRTVLNTKAIKDADKRQFFIESIAKRYELESYISAIADHAQEYLDPNSVDKEAIEALKTKSDEELYSQLATALPRGVIDYVYRVDQVTRKQLTVTELLYLPSPTVTVKKVQQGKSFFESLKLVIWKSLCDPQSDAFKAWYTNGVAEVLTKKFYAAVVCTAFVDLGFAAKAAAVPATALLMKIGIEVYCDRYKPGEILDTRSKTAQ